VGYKRSPKLKPQIEEQLAEQMKPLWNGGNTARQIANKLNFGVLNSPYEELKLFHVWFYRSKFNKGRQFKGKKGESTDHLARFKNEFPKRKGHGIQKGKPRYKVKLEKTMSFQEFKILLNSKLPKSNPENAVRRAFLILLYWTMLRKTEITERLRKDFVLNDDKTILTINLQRKKKLYKNPTDLEPFNLTLESREERLLDEVLDWLRHFKPNERPFNFSAVTAWRYTKALDQRFYCHYFRFNYITKAVENVNDPKKLGELIKELLKETGLDLQTVTGYVMAGSAEEGSITKREIKKLKEEGVITA
jgi:integrase